MVRVSVIIPAYNRAQVLPRAVDSVLAQKDADFELIIVDDGSTDEGDRHLFQKYEKGACPPIRVIRCAENKGPAAARNLGIKHARGEWIAFLDSDDAWKPGKLKAQLEFFAKNPAPGPTGQRARRDYLICQTEEIWIRNGKRVNPMKKHQKYGGWIFEECLPLCVVSPSAVMMHRKLFDEVGLFDESFPACEDYDLWLRIASRYPIGLIETPYIIKYGGHADQRSREFPAMDRFRIRSLAKILKNGMLNPEQTVRARKTLEEKTRIYIEGALKRGKAKEAAEIQTLLTSLNVHGSFPSPMGRGG